MYVFLLLFVNRDGSVCQERILEALCGSHSGTASLEVFTTMYRQGILDDRMVDIDLSPGNPSMDKSPFVVVDRLMRIDKVANGARQYND